jgi:hypothetical protein
MREETPNRSAVGAVLDSIGVQMFLALSTILFAIFSYQGYNALLSFAWRVILLGGTIYGILFLFYGNSGRHITETFIVSFAVIGVTYFVVQCSIEYFASALVLCAVVAVAFHFLE